MKRGPIIPLALLLTLYVGFFSWFTLARHWKTNSNRFDLGNVEQAVWNTLHGRFLVVTNPYGIEQTTRLAFHADFFLAALVPVYAIWPHPETLLILQTLALASGAIAVYLLAKRWIGNPWWGTILAGVYLLNPSVQWTNIFDVHAVTFATPLLLWAVWAAVTKRNRWLIVLAILAVLTKEQVGLLVAGLGVYVWLVQKRPRLGRWLTIGPLVWFFIMTLVTIPSWQKQLDQPPPVFSSYFGSSALQITKSVARHPLNVLNVLNSADSIRYLGQVLGPVAFLAVGSWWGLLAVPDLWLNLMSTKPGQHLLYFHYTATITPWLIIGTIMTITWILRRWTGRTMQFALAGLLMIGTGFSARHDGPLPGAKQDFLRVATWRNPYAASIGQWEQRLPSSAAVAVTNNIGAHFARRQYFYSFPLGVAQADYVVVLEGHTGPEVATQAEVSQKVDELRNDPRWIILEHRGELTVLQKQY